jgi:pimeloyl-ACP methyl ester carboxylesterase
VAFDVRGCGPAVVLLHAFPLHSGMWLDQERALAQTHTVVRVDAPGFGESTRVSSLLTMERIADDAAAVLDHLGLGQAVVAGLSMGGYAAFALVRRHPGRLRALVLADTKAPPDSDQAKSDRAALAERVRREGPAAAAEAMVPRLLGASTRRERPEVVARVRDMILAVDPGAITDALAGLAARADSSPTLREIAVPTLVLCGEEDEVTPPAEAERMERAVAGARRVTVPGAGHLANLENPRAFDQALFSFLASLA